jgi:predicted exporter
MSVKPESLNNAERDLEVMTREPKGVRKASAAVSAEEQLIALRQRIAEGLAAAPAAPIPECVACYRKGWLAALRSLSEE